MEKGKRIDVGFHLLPECIIQHIQSFLCGKEAAETTILSKSWYNTWLTRPNLHFDEADFGLENNFWEFVTSTVQRYDKLNLKVESLRLYIQGTRYSLATELIRKAINMGVIDLYFKVYFQNKEFVLPQEVLHCQNLIRLSLFGCKVGPLEGRDGKVGFSRLECLSLEGVDLVDGILSNIISSCPLIENLSLSECRHSFSPASNVVSAATSSRRLALGSLAYEFRKLKCWLGSMFKTNFSDFSSKFPCLKDFSLDNCRGRFKGKIQISSPSLEFISCTENSGTMTVNFDVPRIRKFIFSCSRIPFLSFTKPTTNNWELSDISINTHLRPTITSFLMLNKLLKNMSQPRISLFLQLPCFKRTDYAGNTLCLPVLENLTIDVPSSDGPALLDCLFGFFRPIFMTQYPPPEPIPGRKRKMEFLKIVHRRLMQMQQTRVNRFTLEEFDVDIFDEAVSIGNYISELIPHLSTSSDF